MKIAIIGAGAIGNVVGGYLFRQGEQVTLVGRADTVAAIRAQGLAVSGCRGDFTLKVPAQMVLTEPPDLLILATKTQDIEEALAANAAFLERCTVLTTQNGVQAEAIVARHFPAARIIASICMFGATYLMPGKVVHNFEGKWIIGRMPGGPPDDEVLQLSLVLNKAFPVVISEKIGGMKYLKIFVNASNCLPAILGMSMQEAFSDVAVSRISVAVWKEGFEVVSAAGIELASLPDFPVENISRLTSIPGEAAAKTFSMIMSKLSKDPLYGSVLQSIMRGRSSEIEYMNGEFIRLAAARGARAPLNEKLVAMVHEVERTKKYFSKEELLAQTRELVD